MMPTANLAVASRLRGSDWSLSLAKGAALNLGFYLVACLAAWGLAHVAFPPRVEIAPLSMLIVPNWLILAALGTVATASIFECRRWIVAVGLMLIFSLLLVSTGAISGPNDVVTAALQLWNARMMLGIWMAVSPCLIAIILARRSRPRPVV